MLNSLPVSDNSRNQKHFQYLLIITICRCPSCLHFIQVWKKRNQKECEQPEFSSFNKTDQRNKKHPDLNYQQ